MVRVSKPSRLDFTPERITGIRSLGSGNVNDTYLVTHADRGSRWSICVAAPEHPGVPSPRPGDAQPGSPRLPRAAAAGESTPELAGRRWEIPQVVPCRQQSTWVEHNGEFWRSITYIGAATSPNVIRSRSHAREVGYGLGMFHSLISDLPISDLADTLEGFHVTPRYLQRYDDVLATHPSSDPSSVELQQFIETRRDGVDVLEAALQRGELQQRPIHGDPKINNVMIDEASGQAVGLIDLDTVKPGLVHYDIGDCLRSCCNPVGEEVTDTTAVRFDLDLCEAVLEGYFAVAGGFLSDWDRHYVPDCIRLIPLELGMRFLTDHLEGNIYFHTTRPDHNLQRAAVQFRLTEEIERQMPEIRAMVRRLTA